METTYKISACYFPGTSEVELTYESLESGESCHLTLPCTHEQGESLVEVIGPCVYYNAVKASRVAELEDVNRKLALRLIARVTEVITLRERRDSLTQQVEELAAWQRVAKNILWDYQDVFSPNTQIVIRRLLDQAKGPSDGEV